MSDASVLQRLAAVIEQRKQHQPAGSYTVQLLQEGHSTIASKVVEEAYELVSAAAEEPDFATGSAIAHEAADLVFHVLVLLANSNVSWDLVERELESRFGVSGLAEKAQRSPPAS